MNESLMKHGAFGWNELMTQQFPLSLFRPTF